MLITFDIEKQKEGTSVNKGKNELVKTSQS